MSNMLETKNPTFEALLEYLRRNHNFDFSGYKRSSLMRRVQQRMDLLHILNYTAYNDYLKEHPEDFNHLFNLIEINVTEFFRDAFAWDYLATQIVPQIIAAKSSSEPIRIWSAGCASGEETYTLAIILAEALGVEQFISRVQIYATDVDIDALNQAKQGRYINSQILGIPPILLERYFYHHVFRQDLRRSIIFSRHNLIEDAPMSKIDLLVCRNVLIYFNTEAQTRALVSFHFSLKDSGFLFLGKAEMLPSYIHLFTPVESGHRVFTKVKKHGLNTKLLINALTRRQQ